MTEKKRMSRPRKPVDTSTYEGRFAVRLRMLREKAGYTPESFAEELGMSKIAIYKWEQAKAAPNVADFPKIAEALQLKSIRTLFPEK